jgi:hypothetical protein
VVVICNAGAAVIVMEKLAVVEVPCESRTPNVTLNVPETEDVPDTTPVLANEIPVGSAPEDTDQE